MRPVFHKGLFFLKFEKGDMCVSLCVPGRLYTYWGRWLIFKTPLGRQLLFFVKNNQVIWRVKGAEGNGTEFVGAAISLAEGLEKAFALLSVDMER